MKMLYGVFLLFVIGCGGSVVYKDNAYEDLLVAISPDVPQGTRQNGQLIIDNIKSFLTSGSASLYTASRGWVYVKSVKILLPTTWDIPADPVDSVVFEDAEIRVDKENPLYGNSPFTLQTGGCGEPGQYSQVTQNFLTNLTSSSSDLYGPPGHVFVHEWSKLRYGVFEEYGYPGDSKYPMFYFKTVWTQSGQENVITPNFCTNTDLEGSMIDMETGSECNYDERSGLPDRKCIFRPNNGTSATSSIMALQYLQKVEQFCDDGEEFYHDTDLPTKQNDLCKERSIWSVIQDHADFTGFNEIKPRNETVPTFTLLQPSEASFVMVLDVSGSMENENRLIRLKQAVKRFVNYDLKNGTKLGVVTFSTQADDPFPLAPITEANKQQVFDVVDGLKHDGGTCMHLGLRKGLQVLRNGGVASGGVMIFLTDGVARCNGDCSNCNGCANNDNGDGVTCVIDEIVNQGVRVITIAFGPNAGHNIEDMADRTNGKAYFVPDNTGPEDINNALDGSLTYQPAGPMADAEILLVQTTFEASTDFSVEFTIDKTIGKQVKIQLDTTSDTLDVFTLVHPNGTEEKEQVIDIDAVGVFQKIYPSLEVGLFTLKIHSSVKVDFMSVRITSKSSEETLPIYTKCWTSTGNGDATPKEGMKLAILAEVMQGSNPVIGANVFAYIERDKQDVPMEIQLFDKGSDPDQIQNDGIYSRYFTRFNKDERYTLKCQVEGTDDTNINQGFIDARKFKVLPSKPTSENPICCGSDTVNEDSILEPTGNFSRSSVGGSFSLPFSGNDFNYPPGTVTDLSVGQLDFTEETFVLSFTAPGDNLDIGIAKSYEFRYSHNKTLLTVDGEYDIISASDVASDEDENKLNPVIANTKVDIKINMTEFGLDQQFYFILVVSDGEKTSQSNTARINFQNIYNSKLIDVVPPTKVTDLEIDDRIKPVENKTFTLTFTAPGDKASTTTETFSKASAYSIKFSTNEDALTNDDGDLVEDMTDEMILNGDLTPVEYNSPVILDIYLETFSLEISYFFQLIASDAAGHATKSNIVEGMFKVKNTLADVVPPTNVTDLTVSLSDTSVNASFIVSFTAPGDKKSSLTPDFDKASSYLLEYSSNEDLMEDILVITDEQLLSGSLDPQDYNTSVLLQVKLDNFTRGETYFFQLIISDDSDHSSQSNIAQVIFEDESGGLGWKGWTGIGAGIAVAVGVVVALTAARKNKKSGSFKRGKSYQVSVAQ